MASDNPIIVVTNIKGTETSISPNNNTNIIPSIQTTTVVQASSLGISISGPQGIRGNTGATGLDGLSGYGYTAAQVVGDYLYISQISPTGIIGPT